MSKKSGGTTERVAHVPQEQGAPGSSPWYHGFRAQALIVALLALLFYGNTAGNEYALDDTLVIVKNEFVHRGISGIPDILTKDAYYSYYDQLRTTNQLSGGRYRPLSIVTFAIEQQIFGAVPPGATDSILAYGLGFEVEAPYEKRFVQEMHVRHVLNIVWYMLAAIALLYLMRYIVFREYPVAALLAAMLFVIHPVHTEVVANVKSRDEIMSLLFICLAFIFAVRHREQKAQWWWLVAGLLSYALAFLSKEYAVTLVVLLPLAFYLFRNETIRSSIVASLPYAGVMLLYVLVRWQVIGPRSDLADNDIQINPYALASQAQKTATEIATSLNYLRLLVFPHPLTSDYSYNQIPYKDFTNPVVWLSLVVHAGLVYGIIYFFRRRSVLCFALAFYLLHLLLVNNFLFDIGATMGERLIFHSSAGFCIVLAFVLYKGWERIPMPQLRWVGPGVLAVVVALCWLQVTARNNDWKNDATLFLKDVEASPNSFLVNMNVGTILVNRSDYEKDDAKRQADLHKATRLFSHVLTMQDDYVLCYLNRGIAYMKLDMADSMVYDLDRVRQLYPVHPSLPDMYYRAAKMYQYKKDYKKAANAATTALQFLPGDTTLQNLLHEVDTTTQAK